MSEPAASLWDRATRAYAQPEIERLCLHLQDEHGQCVSYLLWALWAGERGASLDEALLAQAAAAARDWEERILRPLRAARASLKTLSMAEAGARDAARARVVAEELASERTLLETLEAMTPAAGEDAADAFAMLKAAIAAWGAPAPPASLALLAQSFSRSAAFGRVAAEMSFSDDPPLANDEAIQARIAELRQAHQDLDASVEALQASRVPDQLRIARLKRQKLALRDQIARLEDRLTPDIIA